MKIAMVCMYMIDKYIYIYKQPPQWQMGFSKPLSTNKQNAKNKRCGGRGDEMS